MTSELKEQVFGTQRRAMGDNLLFCCINRVYKTNDKGIEYEDTEEILHEFLEKEMNIIDTKLEIMHRMGRGKNGRHPYIV